MLEKVSNNKLNNEEVQETARVVNELMDDFMKELKNISPKTFGWNYFKSGSYYDKTKVTSFHKLKKNIKKMIAIFEDTKGVIRIYNGQLKLTNNSSSSRSIELLCYAIYPIIIMRLTMKQVGNEKISKTYFDDSK